MERELEVKTGTEDAKKITRDRRTCRQRLSERDKSTMNVRVKALGRLCKT